MGPLQARHLEGGEGQPTRLRGSKRPRASPSGNALDADEPALKSARREPAAKSVPTEAATKPVRRSPRKTGRGGKGR